MNKIYIEIIYSLKKIKCEIVKLKKENLKLKEENDKIKKENVSLHLDLEVLKEKYGDLDY